MAHHHERDRVHAQQPASRPPAPAVQTRPGPSASAARIDCDTCPVAGRGCSGCMVALLGPVRLRLDVAEQMAVDLLVDAGLVEAAEARSAHAQPDLPEWMLQARPAGDADRSDAAATARVRTA